MWLRAFIKYVLPSVAKALWISMLFASCLDKSAMKWSWKKSIVLLNFYSFGINLFHWLTLNRGHALGWKPLLLISQIPTCCWTQVWIGLLAQLTFSNLYDSYMWLGNRYIIYIFIPFWSHHTTSLYIFVIEVFSTWRWCSVAFEIWCFLCNYRCFSYIFSFHRIFCFTSMYIGESV